MRVLFSATSSLLLSMATITCSDPAGSNTPARLVIESTSELSSLLVGDLRQLNARALDAAGREAGPVTVAWSTSHPHIATIDSRGELRIAATYTACNWVTPGECEVRVTARAGDLVATQRITILPYPPTLTVNTRQIDLELGDSTRLVGHLSLEGRAVPWCTVAYASADPAIARVDGIRGVVTGLDEGSTFVHVTVSGPACGSEVEPVRVIAHTPWHSLSIIPEVETIVRSGTTLQLTAQVRNAKGVEYPAMVATWSSSDPTIATVENGLVRILACGAPPCAVTIAVRSGKLTANKPILIE